MTDAPRPEDARRALEAALEAFRRAADRAIREAADPRAPASRAEEARHQATFALASVGAAFKAALRAARPDEEEGPGPRPGW